MVLTLPKVPVAVICGVTLEVLTNVPLIARLASPLVDVLFTYQVPPTLVEPRLTSRKFTDAPLVIFCNCTLVLRSTVPADAPLLLLLLKERFATSINALVPTCT